MTHVEQIYKQGSKVNSYPFKLYYLDSPHEPQTIISIPKRLFKRAVKRNLLRRRTKEALRILRPDYPDLTPYSILLVYISPNILDYGAIKEGLSNTLSKLSQNLEENS